MAREIKTAKAIGVVTILTVISRLFSLWNTQAYLTYFGTGPYMEIYSFALSLPLIVFNGIGTALTVIVIPIFSGYIAKNDEQRAFQFIHKIITISTVTTLALTTIGIAISPLIIYLTRFKTIDFKFGVIALSIMFPVMIFYGLNYIFQGILQSYGKFNMPAIVSIPYSITVILYVYLLGSKFGVKGLLIATFIGLSMQALILIPSVMKQGYRYKFSFDYKDADIKKALKLVIPVLIGTSAYQINMMFGYFLSTQYPTGIVILTTVFNLTMTTIFSYVYSITSVYFPKLSMLAAKDDINGFRTSVSDIIKLLIFSLLPIAVGFSLTGTQIIDIIYGYRKFTPDDVRSAGIIMGLYSLGIIGIGLKEVIDRAFYSLKDTRTPMLNGVIIAAVNIVFSVILVNFMGFSGIALGYSISVLTGGSILLYLICKKLNGLDFGGIITSFIKVGISCAIMALVVISINSYMPSLSDQPTLLFKAIRLFVPVTVGIVVYGVSTLALGVNEAKKVYMGIRTRAQSMWLLCRNNCK